jgi:hypothetical protein
LVGLLNSDPLSSQFRRNRSGGSAASKEIQDNSTPFGMSNSYQAIEKFFRLLSVL